MSPTDTKEIPRLKPAANRLRRRTATVASAVVALVVSVLAGLLGAVPSANAEDNNATYYLDTGNGHDRYIAFINDIRRRVGDDQGSHVPGTTSAYNVDHTVSISTQDSRDFIRVDVHAMGDDDYVRIQLRRSDLYMVGWWGQDGVYRYLGQPGDNAHNGPSSRMGDGGPNDHPHRSAGFGDNYTNIEGAAHQGRVGLAIDPWTINGAVRNLLAANNTEAMAHGVLQMTQWLSEAARFRPLRDEIAYAMTGNGIPFRVPQEYATQENNWGNLSGRFNALLRHAQNYVDPSPLVGWGRFHNGAPQRFDLTTAVAYAQYVLATSNRR